MKHFASFLLVIVGVFAAFLRWLDLVNYTDLSTGFVQVGSVWLRYGAIAVLAVVALLASFMAAKRPENLEKNAPVSAGIAFAAAALFAGEAALRFVVQYNADIFFAESLVYVILGFIAAVWLALFGISTLSAPYRLPQGGAVLGIMGSFYWYFLLVMRFADNNSSFYRMGPTVEVFAAAAALAFITVLVRATYFPQSGVGRLVYFTGMLAFYVGTCFEFPQTLCDFIAGTQTFGTLLQSSLIAIIGVFGAVSAQRCMGAEKKEEQVPEEIQQNEISCANSAN